MQKSRCQIAQIQYEDLCAKYKQFIKVTMSKEIKENQNRRKAKSMAKKREANYQEVKDNQKERKAKCIAKQSDMSFIIGTPLWSQAGEQWAKEFV